MCCCRGSCDLRRSKQDPGELLFGKRMKINKVTPLCWPFTACMQSHNTVTALPLPMQHATCNPSHLACWQRTALCVLQGFMYLFGLVTVAFAVYGLATVDRNITDGAFNVLTTISDYANGAFDTLDDIINTIKGTTDM